MQRFLVRQLLLGNFNIDTYGLMQFLLRFFGEGTVVLKGAVLAIRTLAGAFLDRL